MPRQVIELKKRYGSLLTKTERVEYGRRIVNVRCDCGVEKEVYFDALKSGRTRSCGATACRRGVNAVKVDRKYKPRGTSQVSIAMLKRLWRLHTEEDKSGTSLAEEFDLNKNTLYSAFRAIRRVGGIEAYIKLVQE